MSQWRCKECGAMRAVPHRFRINAAEYLERVDAAPCKRCGSTNEPECDHDPFLDIDMEAPA